MHAYTFYLDSTPSKDLKSAIRLAAHFGWRHTGVAIPTARLAQDFVTLAVDYRCPGKVHFEVLYPFLHALPHHRRAGGLHRLDANFYYGNGKEDRMRQRRLITQGLSRGERKAIFDEERRTVVNKRSSAIHPTRRGGLRNVSQGNAASPYSLLMSIRESAIISCNSTKRTSPR